MSISGRRSWITVVVAFWVTSMVEGLGVSQVFALMPSQLSGMGVPDAERLQFIGLFSALLFVLGMPLVPLWGVWADKYSRKAVIARSALVEAVVFTGMALAREPWQVAVSVMLIGFQLGNTGVMLAAIRDVTPRARLGTIIALFGTSGPVGFALGPTLAAIFIDGFGWSVGGVFAVSAGLSVGTALLVLLGAPEVRPEIVPQGRVVAVAFGALRGVLSDRAVRGVFVIFGAAFLATQMSRPYIPVLVETVVGRGPGLASAIGLVAGPAALIGALLAPVAGALGDRAGFRPVLIGALLAGALALLLMPVVAGAAGLVVLALVAVVFAAASATISAMIFGLLSTEVAADRRSQTLNLVYLPLYAAGIVGPAIGSLVVRAGLPAPFFVGAAVLLVGSIAVYRRRDHVADPDRDSRDPQAVALS